MSTRNTDWLVQGFLLGSLSLILALLLYPIQANTVLNTYAAAGLKFLSGTSPYLGDDVAYNQFNYPPFFAAVFAGLIRLARLFPAAELQGVWILWQWVNATALWLGITYFWSVPFRDPKAIALIIAVVLELLFSMGYGQSNAMMAGLSLLAIGVLPQRPVVSVFLLTLLGNLKVYPIALLFFLPVKPGHLAMGFFAAELFVAMTLGLAGFSAWELQGQWIDIFRSQLGGLGNLDVRTVFSEWGMKGLGTTLAVLILTVTLALGWRGKLLALEAYGLAYSALLLLSPRSEKPTFVFLAPLFALLNWPRYRIPALTSTVLVLLGGWNNANDSAPLSRWKMLGALGFWLIFVTPKIRLTTLRQRMVRLNK